MIIIIIIIVVIMIIIIIFVDIDTIIIVIIIIVIIVIIIIVIIIITIIIIIIIIVIIIDILTYEYIRIFQPNFEYSFDREAQQQLKLTKSGTFPVVSDGRINYLHQCQNTCQQNVFHLGHVFVYYDSLTFFCILIIETQWYIISFIVWYTL